MVFKQFSLDEYYYNSQYSLLYIDYYIDEYVKNETFLLKDAFLESLNVNPSSYRRARQKEQNIGAKYSKILLKFFKINELKIENKIKYESLLYDVYNSFYYKTGNLSDLKIRIQDCINDNTILTPLFNIMLYIVLFQGNGNPSLMLEEYKYIYEYINNFDDKYFISAFKDLKFIININYARDISDIYPYHSIIENSSKKGLIYYILSSKARLCKKYELAILYANESIKYLIKDYNYYRLCHLNVQLCSSLEALGMFEKSLEISKNQFISLEQTGLFLDDILLIRGHYLTSLLGLKRYDEIIDYFNNENTHNYKTYIFYLLASYKTSKEQYNIALVYNKTRDNFEKSKYDYHINEIISFLNSSKKDYQNIKSSSLNEGLINILCNHF